MEKHDGRGVGDVRLDDPWYEGLASDWGEPEGTGTPDAAAPVAVAVAAAGGTMVDPAAAGSTARDAAVRDATAGGGGATEGPAAGGEAAPTPPVTAGSVYLEVQRSAAFQEVRSRYLRFVVPAVVVFLVWYFAYVVAATTAPGLMGRPVLGAVNVAMLAGLGQFLSTFLLTWAYTRHARLRRDRAALDLRWDTQELTRGVGR